VSDAEKLARSALGPWAYREVYSTPKSREALVQRVARALRRMVRRSGV
jgi:hypothetical protein